MPTPQPIPIVHPALKNNVLSLWFTCKNIRNARSLKPNRNKLQEVLDFTVSRKKAQEVAAAQADSVCLFVYA